MVDQFWHVSYPVERADGFTVYREHTAESESEARLVAIGYSRSHGYAMVTNREGLVATYVSGSLWAPRES